MIRLPDVNPARLAKPTPVSRYQPDAEWSGPADLGREAMLRDLALRRGWDLVDDDLAEHRFAAWIHEEDARFDEEVAALLPAEAKGFAERTTRGVFERAKMFKASLPEGTRPAIDEAIAGYEQGLFAKAAAAEDRAQVSAVRENLDVSLEAKVIPAARAVAALPAGDPEKFDRYIKLKAGRFERIDRNPALPLHERQQRRAAEAKAIDTAFAEALSPEEKQDLDPEAAIETVGERIHRLGAERREAAREVATDDALGDTAAGDGASTNPEGFGWEAWLNLIRQQRPDLAEGRTIVAIQALRADPELAAEMREIGLPDSARFLTENGQAATPGRLYLAHLTSRETTLRLLQADPDSLAVDADPEVAPARADLFYVDGDEAKPRTVGEVIALAEEAMAGTRPVDWRQQMTGASPEMQAAFAADGRDAAARAATEARLAEEDTYRARINETEQAIEAGTFGHADLVKAAGEGGWIRGDDFPRLFNLLAKRQSANLEYERALSKFTDPDYQFDPASTEDQHDVDLLYERDPANNAAAVVDGDPQARQALRRVLARTGILPSQVRQAMEAAITSGDEAARRRALALVEDTLLWTADQTIPEGEKELAEVISQIRNFYYRKLGNTTSIAEVVAKVEELRNRALRAGVGHFFGPLGVSLYDWGLRYIDDRATEVREYIHRLIDESNKGRSALEITNRKNFFDGLFTLAMAVPPGPGLGRGRFGGRRRGSGAEQGLDPETFQKLGYSKDDGFGKLRHVERRKIGGVEYRVFRVRTKQEPGGSSDAAGAAEYNALNKPEKNAIYELDNGKWFKTNAFGYVVELEFKPTDPMRGRNTRQANTGKGTGSKKGDQGGHLQAKRLGGSSDQFNLIPQNANFNGSAYKILENRIHRNIDDIRNVKITLTRKDPKSPRPDELLVEFELNGVPESHPFPNQAAL